MPDWIHTLEARFAGRHAGFLDANAPLEDQDTDQGGPNVPNLPADQPVPADQPASDVPAEDTGATSSKKSGSR